MNDVSTRRSTARAAAGAVASILMLLSAACASDPRRTESGLPPHVEPPWHSEPPPGLVHLRFDVTADGRVTDVIVVESYPPGVFDAQAIASIRRRRYKPSIVDGVAVERPGIEVLLRFDDPEDDE